MPRFVLLYVKEDDAADHLIERCESGDVIARVVGMYKDPQHSPCSCDNSQWQITRMWGINRNFGWPIHQACGRISPFWRAGYGKRMFQVFGTNLLSLDKTPKIFQDWKQQSR